MTPAKAACSQRRSAAWATVPGAGTAVTHTLAPGRVGWVQVARGSATLNGEQLYPGDGVAIEDAGSVEITGTSADAEVLLFDMKS